LRRKPNARCRGRSSRLDAPRLADNVGREMTGFPVSVEDHDVVLDA